MGCEQPGEQETGRWRVGVSGAGFRTRLSFEDGYSPTLSQGSAALSVTLQLDKGWSLRLAGGTLLWGSLGQDPDLDPHDGLFSLDTGWHGAAQVGKRWRAAEGALPSVDTSLGLAVGRSPMRSSSKVGHMLATDVRLGVAVGWEIAGTWSPYLAAQVFGGPVVLDYQWLGAEDIRVMGTDVHHYRASVGSALHLGQRASIYLDFAPLGERGLAGGVSIAL